ncbi:copper chaperone PCu(A)C [Thauera sp. SDU_THAU2]|uniref:copper chaperone PCu(A)C n=1 Tax=Thauera sp. SDU_THAU2 TaxID=3136633 RepID=UPI00311F2C76
MKKTALALALVLGSLPAFADVTVADAWVRATVAQQKATGAFMQLKSDRAARLVAAASPLAGVVEIHEMRMEGEVMRMNPVAALDLPAGETVELKPGGYHVMLLDLKQQVKAGDEVPLSIVIEQANGERRTIELKVPACPLNAVAGGHRHGQH